MKLKISKTLEFENKYPNLGFGLATVANCIFSEKHSSEFKSEKKQILKSLRTESSSIKHNIDKFSDFFNLFGFVCPLSSHFEKTITQGFPNRNIFLDIHIIAEMNSGLLMGIQDCNKFMGNLKIDIAKNGESFEGICSTITCIKDEIIIRDDRDIVASLLQGPDKRTLVDKSTVDVALYAFMVPEIEETVLLSSLEQSVEMLKKHAHACDSEIQIV